MSKILFFGLGSIGKRHVKILKNNYDHELFAFRTDKKNYKNLSGVKSITSWREFEKINPEIAFITNPTFKHIESATACAKRGCALFIEKPLGSSINGLSKLLEIIKSKNIPTYVAYNLRFHPIIDYIKRITENNKLVYIRATCSSYLPLWRPDQDYKKSYSASLDLGGGVVLELSHEIDYIYYLLGRIDKISGQFSQLTDITVDSEDYAEILIESDNTPRASIHTNYASHYKERKIIADFEGFTLNCDLISKSINKYSKEELIEKKEFDIHQNYTYEKQLDYFFKYNSPTMMNNIFEATSLFNKIIDFKEN